MELGNHLAIRRAAAVPLAPDRSTAVEVRSTPLQKAPASGPDPSASSAPLFSVLEDEYVAIRERAGATKGTISTIRTRVRVFKD